MTDHIDGLRDDQSPPHHEDSEYAAVGCALIDPTGEALRRMTTIIGPTDFFDGRAAIVYEACLTVADSLGRVDAVLVHEHLCESGRLSEIGGPMTLEWYRDAVAHTVHAEHYARIVAKNAIRRQVYHAARDLAIAAHEAHESLDTLRDRVRHLAEMVDTRMPLLRPIDRERGGLE